MDIETKRQNFKRLAEKRTQAIIDDLRILTNLTNTNNYEYDEEEVKKIFAAIEAAVKNSKKEFNKELNSKFKL